jgi:hypothetical protein
MGQIGFTTYVQPEPAPEPTLAERFATLSGAQKIAVLDGFSAKTLPNDLKHSVAIAKDLIIGIYREIDAIEETARLLMREEVIITEGTYDGSGNEITAPEYNTAPSTISELKAEVALSFTDIFTTAEVGAVINAMISYSEIDSSGSPIGTAAVYSAEVIK